jgi:serine protease Do
MKKYFFTAAALAVFAFAPALAQDKEEKAQKDQKEAKEKSKDKDKLNEYDEIIIKQKDADKDGKVTVEIKDGKVTVNGKPLEDYDDDNISVRKRSASRYRLVAPSSPFRTDDLVWEDDGHGAMWNDDRAFLGVSTEEADEQGAKIVSVSEKSAAEKAGLKKGDIITKINEKKIESPDELTEIIGTYKPSDKINITYTRDGKQNTLTGVALGKRESMGFGHNQLIMPSPQPFVAPDMKDFNFRFNDGELGEVFAYGGKPRLGIKAQDTEDDKGVKVVDVDENSAAAKAGLKKGDIITEFEGEEVNSADELASASRESRDKSTLKVKINRGGKAQTLEIKVPKKLKTTNL